MFSNALLEVSDDVKYGGDMKYAGEEFRVEDEKVKIRLGGFCGRFYKVN